MKLDRFFTDVLSGTGEGGQRGYTASAEKQR